LRRCVCRFDFISLHGSAYRFCLVSFAAVIVTGTNRLAMIAALANYRTVIGDD
jgi:hypothetical protein